MAILGRCDLAPNCTSRLGAAAGAPEEAGGLLGRRLSGTSASSERTGEPTLAETGGTTEGAGLPETPGVTWTRDEG